MARTETGQSIVFSQQSESVFSSFEAEWKIGCDDLLDEFLSQVNENERANALIELIRIDMELNSIHAQLKDTQHYLDRYPLVASDKDALQSLLFEEFRLRRATGHTFSPKDIASRYGVESSDWVDRLGAVSTQRGSISRRNQLDQGQLFLSQTAVPMSLAKDGFPDVPSRFLRFELVGVLGEGAMGRVYLAQQDDLAKRFVALKITRELTSEPDRLAQLQHTNIVPVFSLHRVKKLQAICMPFLGLTTLADLETYATNTDKSLGGRELISTVAELRDSTIANRISKIAVQQLKKGSSGRLADRFSAVGSRSIEETLGWLFQQVAEGLGYAHEHGIVHGDIKPANILLSDDGHPLLLDFHLAQSTVHKREQSVVGGTLPFMSAEHLSAFINGGTIDKQCDVFSVGAVFYKLLTGDCPYPIHSGPVDEVAQAMLADRKLPAIPLRKRMQTVDLDLATIVEKCLDPNPNNRYSSGEQIAVDLRRHNENLPLVHAPNRSVIQRIRKWIRRNPGVKSMSSMVTMLLVLLGLSSALVIKRTIEIRRSDSIQQSNDFVAQLQRERLPLTTTKPTEQALDASRKRIQKALQTYGARSAEEWRDQSRLRFLTPAHREQETHAISSIHLQTAEALVRRARILLDNEQKQKLLDRAELESARAVELQPSLEQSRTVLAQKSAIARLRSQNELAEQFWEQAIVAPISSELDRMVAAYGCYTTGNTEDAFRLIQESIQEDPQNIEAWLLLGNLHTASGHHAEAAAAYGVCIGLDPRLEIAFFNRALARRAVGDMTGSLSDFDAAIRINSDDWSNFANRSLLQMAIGNHSAALNDLDAAIQLGAPDTRLYYLRAQVHRNLGNDQKAAADYSEFVSREATDETSCVEHGAVMLQEGKFDEAARDFDRAIQLNPRSVESWQNKAHIFSEIKQEVLPAIDAMSQVVAILPSDPASLATRGVLHARSGNRTEALKDASAALAISQSGDTLYRVSGIFAQTSKLESNDKHIAIGFLSGAMLLDPQTVMGYLDRDTDLQPLAEEPEFVEFRKLVSRLQELGQWRNE